MAMQISYISKDYSVLEWEHRHPATYLGIGETGRTAIEAMEFIPNEMARASSFNVLNVCESWAEEKEFSNWDNSFEEEQVQKMCKEAKFLAVFMDVNNAVDANHAQKMVEIYKSNGEHKGPAICISTGTKLEDKSILNVFDTIVFVGSHPERLSCPANIMLYKEYYGYIGIDYADTVNTIKNVPILYFISRSCKDEKKLNKSIKEIEDIVGKNINDSVMHKILHYTSPAGYGLEDVEKIVEKLCDYDSDDIKFQHLQGPFIKEYTISFIFGVATNKNEDMEKWKCLEHFWEI